MRNYTNKYNIEQLLGGSSISANLDRYMESAEKMIEKHTGRIFVADETATARLFNGNNKQELFINECISVSKVEVGSNDYGDSFTEVTKGGSNGYYLYPNNYSADELPIRSIHLRSRIWIPGLQNHRITAKWGYSQYTPKDIEFVATVLAAGMYQFYRSSGFKGAKSESIGNYSVTYATQNEWADYKMAMELLDQYKKYYF